MRGKELTEQQKLILMGLCGGKCEFRGCNDSVIEELEIEVIFQIMLI